MKELELKFLEIDKASLVEKLQERGARLTVDSVLRTVYFDTVNGDFKRKNELFRLRTFGDKIELCRKVNMRLEDGCKVHDELEVHVSDFDKIVELLETLGYVQAIYFEKRRTEYVLEDGTKFEIDEFPGVPVFLEIEALDAARIEELVLEFDLSQYETTPATGQEVLKEKYGVDMVGLKF
ncbi:class IV adenylate cyclase [Candidatus Peregrinibacteria bacterium]|jgi:adenylate cyclase, class 2|nr:class IV adenylate cyclase [Candidatus Peregrinibacteria bacterium]